MLCTTAMKGGVDQLVSDVFLQNVFSPQKKLQLQFDSLQEVDQMTLFLIYRPGLFLDCIVSVFSLKK